MASKCILLTLAIATLALVMHSSVMVTVSQKPPSCKTGSNSRPSGPIILFNVTFNASEARTYRDFIAELRRHIEEHGNCSIVGGVPMLPPEEHCRNQYFHINLSDDNSNNITLLIRLANLYFVAFQNARAQWYEFRPEGNSSPIINTSVLLPFTNRYSEKLAQTRVGQVVLIHALGNLANYIPKNNPQKNIRSGLMSLMVMFPEAIRFGRVADFVHDEYLESQGPEIGTSISILIRNWGSMSRDIRLYGNLSVSIQSMINASTYVGVVCMLVYVPVHGTNAVERWTLHNMVGDWWKYSKYPYIISYIYGQRLVEIFWVQILNIDNKNPGELYGEIQVVDDGLDNGLNTPHYIFNRNRCNSLSIKPKEYVPLTGPTRAISPHNWFYIDVSLMYCDTEVSSGWITWNNNVFNVYDTPLWAEVMGNDGSIAVNYAVYRNAVTATIQVKQINVDSEYSFFENTSEGVDSVYSEDVYGTINASNTLSNENITLFNKYNKNYEDINPLEHIPLLRSVVVVPLISSIKVVANLWDFSDVAIAQGSLTFKAATDLCNTGRIRGVYSGVEVMVTWSSSWA